MENLNHNLSIFQTYKNSISNYLNRVTVKSKERKKLKKENTESSKNYFFYFELWGKIIHVKNINNGFSYTLELYISNDGRVDTEIFRNSIFVCGGCYSEKFLNTCIILNLETKTLDKSKNLTEKKRGVSLISTRTLLYCIGGFDGAYLNTCEYYSCNESKWLKNTPLNNSSCLATVCFDEYKYIYIFGSSTHSEIERLNCSSLNYKWENLKIHTLYVKKYSGFYFMLNNFECLIFGGYSPHQKNYYLINHYFMQMKNLNKSFLYENFMSCSASRALYWNKNILIISLEHKVMIQIDLI